MSDLSSKKASTSTKITGANNTSGDETNFVGVSSRGAAQVAEGLSSGGTQGVLTLTSANVALEAKVGATSLAERVLLTVQAIDADIYWGYTSGVTVATGTRIKKNGTGRWSLNPNSTVTIYVVCATAAATCRVSESP